MPPEAAGGSGAAEAPGLPGFRPAELGPAAVGGFTGRAGGTSTGPYGDIGGSGGLNLGPHVGDDPRAVHANRGRIAAFFGVPVAWMSQVHGATVLRAPEPAPDAGELEAGEADALVAAAGEEVALGVMVADCVPVLLADEEGNVAAAHVGRDGLVRGVLDAAVRALRELGGGSAVHAALGPSICGRCYEVPAAMRDDVARHHPAAAATTSWGTPALDLPAGVRARLTGLGVAHVGAVRACTFEDERLYSHRRAGRAGNPAVTGRFAGVVRGAADTPGQNGRRRGSLV